VIRVVLGLHGEELGAVLVSDVMTGVPQADAKSLLYRGVAKALKLEAASFDSAPMKVTLRDKQAKQTPEH
jgi:hypothetical protein